jgi:hypothetical protein
MGRSICKITYNSFSITYRIIISNKKNTISYKIPVLIVRKNNAENRLNNIKKRSSIKYVYIRLLTKEISLLLLGII